MDRYYIEMLDYDIYVSIKEDHQELLKQLGKQWYNLEPDDGTRAGSCSTTEDMNAALIRLNITDQGTVAHESLHAANAILNYMGVKASNTNDEFQAYLLEWIVGKVTKSIEKFEKKK